jgi:hypothetical protein
MNFALQRKDNLMNSAPWYSSKILWVGIITVVIATLMSVVDLLNKGNVLPQDYLLLAVGILNSVLRVFFSDQKLTA